MLLLWEVLDSAASICCYDVCGALATLMSRCEATILYVGIVAFCVIFCLGDTWRPWGKWYCGGRQLDGAIDHKDPQQVGCDGIDLEHCQVAFRLKTS